MLKIFDTLFDLFLSARVKKKIERAILIVAIVAFIVHLVLIGMVDLGWINSSSELIDNPISAIYTPFSFILIYEVYLLIYYLPKSITTYISKQYEIITLIIIRRLFKDLGQLELKSDWFENQQDLQFTYDLVASIILFYLLFLFFKLSKAQFRTEAPESIRTFIKFKRFLALALVPVFLGLAIYSLTSWSMTALGQVSSAGMSFKDINNLFFDEFFTILIVVDVLLLLLSFFYTDHFYKVFRNSGFIITTILIRISFGVDGLTNTALIIIAVAFGLLILKIHNLFEKNDIRV